MIRELREKVVALAWQIVKLRERRLRVGVARGIVWENERRLRDRLKELDALLDQIERGTTAEQVKEEKRDRRPDTVHARLLELRAANRAKAAAR